MNRMACFLLTMVLSVTGFGWQGPVWAEPASARIDLEQIQVLDLATASKIALAENPTLEVAQARLDQAREALNQARAAYWPRLDLSASGTRVELSDTAYQSQSALYRALGTTVEDPQDYYRAGLAASWSSAGSVLS